MTLRAVTLGSALALATSVAMAAGPARTPASYTTKALAPNEVSVNETYVWDADSRVQVAFTNAPDVQGRPFLSLDFLHLDGSNSSTARFRSQPLVGTTNSGDSTLRRIEGGSTATTNATATPNGAGLSELSSRLRSGAADLELYYVSSQTGYSTLISTPGFYGDNGFNGGGAGVGSWGMFAFRFTDTQSQNNTSMVRYSFATSGDSTNVRARLLYADRQGADGYNSLRFFYRSPGTPPVSGS